MTTQLTERIDQLTRSRVPFVQATVVRAQEPSSAHAGDRAIVLADGTIEGFVGGQCARRLGAHGCPRRAGVRGRRTPAGAAGRRRLVPADAGCEHRGEPVPVRRSVGDLPRAVAPVARALRRRARPRPPTRSRRSPPRSASSSTGPAEGARPDGAVAAIVSSHGGDEPAAIRAALDAGVGFVGLVSSHTRGEAVLAELDLTDDERRRVHAHVGLDIGARTAPEIALSILAAIVEGHPAGGADGHPPAGPRRVHCRRSTRCAA